MKVLVTAASKHGSTEEIARAIAEVLEKNGLQAVVSSPDVHGTPRDHRVVLVHRSAHPLPPDQGQPDHQKPLVGSCR